MTNEELVVLIQSGNDKRRYLEELYNKNRNLICDVANRYGSFAEIDDLIQEGYFGLVKAAESWDKTKGTKFSTYAVNWIRAFINRYIDNNAYVVRIPAYQRAMITKINRVSEAYYKEYAHAPSIQELSVLIDETEALIKAVLHDAVFLSVQSTSEVISPEDESISLEDAIKDPINRYEILENDIQNEQLSSVLWNIVDELKPEEAAVLHRRYEHNKSVEDVAQELGHKPCHVRYVERNAIKALGKGKNRRVLWPFFSDEKIYSISIHYSSYGRFKNTWTSSTEEAVLMAEN